MSEEFLVLVEEDQITAKSTFRLPFDPKARMREFRDEIRAALLKLENRRDDILHCVYRSEDSGFCDLENVLQYNFGPSNFDHLVNSGISLQRSRSIVAGNFDHEMVFSFREAFDEIQPQRTICEFQFSLTSISSSLKPATYWHKCRTGEITCSQFPILPARIGLKIHLEIHEKENALCGKLKALLDGIVSSFHSHDGSDLDEVAKRLAYQLPKIAITELKSLLIDKTVAVLGERCLLRKFKNGIQWNPADDWIDRLEIDIVRRTINSPRIKGLLYIFD